MGHAVDQGVMTPDDMAAPTMAAPARDPWERVFGRARFALATPADDAEIRRLLRENPMPGRVALSLEREPDASLAARVEGDVHRTIVARYDRRDRIVAMGGVSVRTLYVNGRPTRVGYLGQLRSDRRQLSGFSIRDGYAFLRSAVLPMLDASLYFTSIAADNDRALRLFERGLPDMPVYRPLDRFVTSLFPMQARRARRRSADVKVDAAGPNDVAAIADCLRRNGQRYQLFPDWQESELAARERAGEIELVVARRGGRVVGCMSAWDQSSYKQTVIRGYRSPEPNLWRPIVNAVGPWFNVPHLPPVGTPLNLVYLSHVAVDDDDPDVFAALLRYGCWPTDRFRRREKTSYFVLGLSSRHPLLRAIPRRFRRHTYETNLYAVEWPDCGGGAALPSLPPAVQLDGRPLQPEVALL